MLSVSESALNHLASILNEAPGPAEGKDVLRLTSTGSGLALVADEKRDGDEVHHRAGTPVLVLEAGLADALADQSLQVNVEDGRPRLALNPKSA